MLCPARRTRQSFSLGPRHKETAPTAPKGLGAHESFPAGFRATEVAALDHAIRETIDPIGPASFFAALRARATVPAS